MDEHHQTQALSFHRRCELKILLFLIQVMLIPTHFFLFLFLQTERVFSFTCFPWDPGDPGCPFDPSLPFTQKVNQTH